MKAKIAIPKGYRRVRKAPVVVGDWAFAEDLSGPDENMNVGEWERLTHRDLRDLAIDGADPATYHCIIRRKGKKP